MLTILLGILVLFGVWFAVACWRVGRIITVLDEIGYPKLENFSDMADEGELRRLIWLGVVCRVWNQRFGWCRFSSSAWFVVMMCPFFRRDHDEAIEEYKRYLEEDREGFDENTINKWMGA